MRRYIVGQERNHQDRKKIIDALARIEKIERHLDDVLTHPDETAFSVKPVVEQQKLIKEKLDMVIAELQEIEKRLN